MECTAVKVLTARIPLTTANKCKKLRTTINHTSVLTDIKSNEWFTIHHQKLLTFEIFVMNFRTAHS